MIRSKKEKTCEKCGKQFRVMVLIDGKVRNLNPRHFCLDCSPFGQHNTQNLCCPIDRTTPRVCKRCGKQYIYDRKRGHRKEYCNSCKVICHDIQKKQRAVEYKGGCCQICGYDKCLRSLTFHHRDPDQKEFTVGQGHSRSWESMRRELDKCDLLCHNCHNEVHDGMHEGYLI